MKALFFFPKEAEKADTIIYVALFSEFWKQRFLLLRNVLETFFVLKAFSTAFENVELV